MNFLQAVNTVIVLVGVPSSVAAFVFIGRKLQLLDSLNESVGKIKHNMKVIGDYLTRHHIKFNPLELQALSPISLTDLGKEFVEKIGFENVFEKNKKDFFNFIDNENPKLKYDVEMAAIKSIYSLYEKSYMDFLKVYFYNNPDRTLENTAPTLGVYIRDVYLSEHPEITQ